MVGFGIRDKTSRIRNTALEVQLPCTAGGASILWTLPQACCGPWYHSSIRVQCSTPYMGWHILEYMQHAGSSPVGSCGLPWPPTSPCGAGNASNMPGRR
jgi:hypothetical protein